MWLLWYLKIWKTRPFRYAFLRWLKNQFRVLIRCPSKCARAYGSPNESEYYIHIGTVRESCFACVWFWLWTQGVSESSIVTYNMVAAVATMVDCMNACALAALLSRSPSEALTLCGDAARRYAVMKSHWHCDAILHMRQRLFFVFHRITHACCWFPTDWRSATIQRQSEEIEAKIFGAVKLRLKIVYAMQYEYARCGRVNITGSERERERRSLRWRFILPLFSFRCFPLLIHCLHLHAHLPIVCMQALSHCFEENKRILTQLRAPTNWRNALKEWLKVHKKLVTQ